MPTHLTIYAEDMLKHVRSFSRDNQHLKRLRQFAPNVKYRMAYKNAKEEWEDVEFVTDNDRVFILGQLMVNPDESLQLRRIKAIQRLFSRA